MEKILWELKDSKKKMILEYLLHLFGAEMDDLQIKSDEFSYNHHSGRSSLEKKSVIQKH